MITVPVAPVVLYLLAVVQGNQLTITTDLTKEQCAKATEKGLCVPYFPKIQGVTLVKAQICWKSVGGMTGPMG
jgi:hypothetical protein